MAGKDLEPYSLEKEKAVRQFWEKEGIPEKVREESAKKDKTFYFMDGPPYATGHIHMGTALNKILKDVAMRYWRMKGFNVFDRPGYDTHGLPIENKIEKELGFEKKEDIEKFGVKNFVDKCREFATKFIDTMNNEFNDLGVWMDWDNPYITLKNEYIEAVWFSFKKAHEKELLYLGKYPVHLCPRCATAVAYNEIVYEKVTDDSIYVKFKVNEMENTYLLIWTTTPWTLPGNTGVMAHPDYEYAFAKLSNGETWIIAKELVEELMKALEAGFTIEKVVKGKELEGLTYINPLSKHLKLGELKNAYRVILNARYVNLDSGTGLVHTAPGYGREDFDAGTKAGLPVVSIIKLNGEMTEEGGKYAGKKAKEVDVEIVEDLKKENALVYQHPYTHDYPLCWRCKSPLLMVGLKQWFFKISEIQPRLIELNKAVKWVPKWMQDRMDNWLESLGDWPVSRARYWGTPIPIWQCGKCQEIKVVGSLKELKELAKVPEDIDLHKPEIDGITMPCQKCEGEMKRVPEVLDVWFDAGVSSWGALGLSKSRELFDKFWPADLNIEGSDQFRGWWNSELILSTICFDQAPFKSIMVHGMVLAPMGRKVSKAEMAGEKKQKAEKMSKSLGNIVMPREVIEKYNRDYLRYFLASNSKGEDFAFDWNAFNDIGKFFNIFWNSFHFVNLYLEIKPVKAEEINLEALQPEDRWLLAKTSQLIKEVSQSYESYNYPKAIALFSDFVLEDLSRTYIKLIRARVGTESGKAAQESLNYSLASLLGLLSPVTPHIAEYVYQKTRTADMPESIHLTAFPKMQKKFEGMELVGEMALVKEIAANTLALREENKLRLRWPLEEVMVKLKKGKLESLLEVLAKMCNVKKASLAKDRPEGNFAVKELNNYTIYLNVEASPELKEEWELRELTRRIQAKRKEAKLNPLNVVQLWIYCSDPEFLEKHKKKIAEQTNTIVSIKEGRMEKVLDREFSIVIKK